MTAEGWAAWHAAQACTVPTKFGTDLPVASVAPLLIQQGIAADVAVAMVDAIRVGLLTARK